VFNKPDQPRKTKKKRLIEKTKPRKKYNLKTRKPFNSGWF
jgi:hypothetical protein